MGAMRSVSLKGRRLRTRESQDGQWEWEGDASASILVAGHSHRDAFRSAIAGGFTADGPGAAILVARGPVDPAAPPKQDDTYWRAACAAEGRVLAVTWKGNQVNTHFLFESDEPFRLSNSGESGKVVPASMISAAWKGAFDGLDAAVANARAEHVVLIGNPPPKPDEEVRASLPDSPYFVRAMAAAGESPDTIRITPAAVRVGLWKILQDDYAQQAARIGAVFVPVPDTVQTSDGCLKPEYSGRDVTHANGVFGALMLREIEATVRQ